MSPSDFMVGQVREGAVLAAETLAVLGLLGLLGIGPVLRWLPGSAAARWPVYAPAVGLALLSVAGLPLALLGLPVGRWAPILAGLGGVIGLAAVASSVRSQKGRRLLFSYLRTRRGGVAAAAAFVVPVLLSTFLVVGRHGGSVRDVWGSGDFGAYWIVADYLQDNGATLESYRRQSAFHASDIADHLSKHARLGCMVSLAVLGAVLSPGNVHHAIIPFIVAAIVLMLGLAQRWRELERAGSGWLFLPLLSYPFLYFLLYFTYLSQATGVLLFLASLVLADGSGGAARGRKRLPAAILSGVLAGASVLHYPSLLAAVAICAVLLLGREVRSGTPWSAALWCAAAAVACGYYLPQVAHELRAAHASTRLPGWDWRSVIGPLEFLGLRSVLGYDLPRAGAVGLKPLDYLAGAGLLALLCRGVWLSRLRVAALTVVTTTGLLGTAAVVKILQHVPNATHAFVKVVSTFAPCLFVVMLVPLERWVARRRRARGPVVGLAAMILVAGHLVSLDYGARQIPWYTDDLVVLARRQLAKGFFLRFDRALYWQMRAPIVRDLRRAPDHVGVAGGRVLTMVREERLSPGDRLRVVDREGAYVAVYNATGQ